jgi:hypothetical protein
MKPQRLCNWRTYFTQFGDENWSRTWYRRRYVQRNFQFLHTSEAKTEVELSRLMSVMSGLDGAWLVTRVHRQPHPWNACTNATMDHIGNENKGNTNKRTGVHSAALALSCFTQPNAFLCLVMPKLVNNSNGLLIERFLVQYVFHQPKVLLYMNYRSQQKPERNQPIFSRNEKLYERIHAKHNNSDNVLYSLEEETLDIYVRHSQNNLSP